MNRLVTIGLLLVCAGGLWTVGPLNQRLVEARRQTGFTQADPLINAPPLVVFTTVALGGFRGIIADLLWMRSARLQQEGRYFELVQLADWITKLQPRFTEVWAYQAWNLSYNITVMFSDPSDRWRWVRNGIALLRDEGLVYNPGSARLLHELGWLFQHKIGTNTDDAHLYYKQAWAMEMQNLFGGGRPDYAALANDPDRLRRMRDEYKLDPAIMQQIEARHGPLDWRMAQAHAIYWATLSAHAARGSDIIAANRMIYQSTADAFRRGLLFTGADGTRFIPSPHLALLPYAMQTYETAIANPDEHGNVQPAYQFFLRETAVLMYLYNRMDDARRLLNRLKELDPTLDKSTNIADFVFEVYTTRGLNMSQDEAYNAVESALYQSALWASFGDEDRAAGFDQLARMVWTRYMAPRMDTPVIRERTGLPPLEDIRIRAAARVTGR